MDADQVVNVLYIAGYGRSGSTLLDRMLGSVDNAVSTGELEKIWIYGFRDNNLCTCGERFGDCAFWCKAIANDVGDFENNALTKLIRIKQRYFRVRHLGGFVFRRIFRRPANVHVKYFQETWRKLLRGICEASGASIVVDSSKTPHMPFCMSNTTGLKYSIVHLVRDSRAVAFSYGRKKEAKENNERSRYIKRSGFVYSSLAWLSWNLIVHFLSRKPNYVRIRYEDLVDDPERELAQVLSLVDAGGADLDIFQDSGVELQDGHLLAGNPMRFQKGVLALTADSEWQSEMNPWRKLGVTIITLPLLLVYGYPIWIRS